MNIFDKVDPKVDPKIDEQLKKVKFFVNANSFEHHQLWKDYFYNPKENIKKVDWKQEMAGGFSLTLAYITIKEKPYPIVVIFSFDTINNVYVCFYYSSSMVVHHGLIDNFLRKNYPIKYDKRSRNAYTDATNFYHCYQFCLEERNKRYKIKKENNFTVMRQKI